MSNYFEQLNGIDVSKKIDKKGKLTYLSWAWAWGELKKIHPTATSKVYEQENGLNYWHDDKTAWVKASVTVDEIEHIEYLPIMDFKNKSVSLDALTSTDVNKAIQRCITKAIARHGLGLYIYAGEDLPEEVKDEKESTLDFVIKKMKELVEFHGSRENVYALMNITTDQFKKEYNSDINKVADRIKQLTNNARKNNDEIIKQEEATETKVVELDD